MSSSTEHLGRELAEALYYARQVLPEERWRDTFTRRHFGAGREDCSYPEDARVLHHLVLCGLIFPLASGYTQYLMPGGFHEAILRERFTLTVAGRLAVADYLLRQQASPSS